MQHGLKKLAKVERKLKRLQTYNEFVKPFYIVRIVRKQRL